MEEWGRTFHEIIRGGIKVGPSVVKRDTAGIPLKITNVTFSDEDYEGNEIRSLGSKLYDDTTYLMTYLSYTVLNNVGNVDIYYKIIDPNGDLVTNTNTKGMLELTAKGSYTKCLGGWGNKNKTAYSTPGEYNIEFYYKGKCLYKSKFTIHESLPKKSSDTIPSIPLPHYTPTTKTSIRSSGGLWRRMNNAIKGFGERIDDSIDSLSDPKVWTIIIGIIGAIGLIAAAISTDSIFWGIVVVFFGLGIGYYAVFIGGAVISFIVRFILYIFRYLFYNIYTVILAVLIAVGIIVGPWINELIDNSYGAETVVVVPNVKTEVTTTYYCTASSILNIRSSPNKDAKVIGTIRRGQSVQVYSIVDGYAKFKYGSGYGYASIKYLRKAD